MLAFPSQSPAAVADGPGSGDPWIVSLGDSAISGEGGRWAGNSNEPAAVVDALGEVAYNDGVLPGTIGLGSLCLEAQGGHQVGSAVVPAPCAAGSSLQSWLLNLDDTVRTGPDLCLTAIGVAAGSPVQLDNCRAGGDQQWQQRGGRLVNEASARCLAGPSPSSAVALVLADCSGGSSDTTQVFSLPGSYEQIGGCHRSRAAAVHIERTSAPTGPTPDVAVNSMNFACSGARTNTKSYSSGDDYKPGIDFAITPVGLPPNHKGQALLLEEFALSHNVTGVALMIGGNNFGYAEILAECIISWFFSPFWAPDYCSEEPDIQARVTAEFQQQLSIDIQGAIENVRLAMGQAGYDESMYTIFVHNYWAVMPVGSEFRYGERGYDRQTLGGCGVWDRDANWAESVARPSLNGAVTNAVAGLGHPNVELVDLTNIVRSHELCGNSVGLLEEKGYGHWSEPGVVDNTEWITQVRIGPALPPWLNPSPPEYQLQEGGHANYWGQLAMRNCLRQAYNNGAGRSVSCSPAAGGGVNAYGEPSLDVTPS